MANLHFFDESDKDPAHLFDAQGEVPRVGDLICYWVIADKRRKDLDGKNWVVTSVIRGYREYFPDHWEPGVGYSSTPQIKEVIHVYVKPSSFAELENTNG